MKAQYLIEAAGFSFIGFVFRQLSLKRASRLGQFLTRWTGPLLPLHRMIQQNLNFVFPDKSPEEKRELAYHVWEEWGRVVGEYFHLPAFSKDLSWCTLHGQSVLQSLISDQKGAILFTGHLSHFQLITIVARHYGLSLCQFYRRTNNPFVNKTFYRLQRQATDQVFMKSAWGLKQLILALRNQEHIFMIIDQKSQQGEMIPFLGKPASTALSAALLAKKFHCPLVPVRVQRKGLLHFDVTFYPPLDHCQDPIEMMREANIILGQWVLEQPDQWFWLHNRWGLRQKASY